MSSAITLAQARGTANALKYTEIVDPGTTGTFDFKGRSGVYVNMVSAAGDAGRTLSPPAAPNDEILLVHYTDAADITVTVTTGYDEAGAGSSDTLVFSAVGQFVKLQGIAITSTTNEWRVIAYDGATGPTLNLASINTDDLTVSGTSTLTGAVTAAASISLGDSDPLNLGASDDIAVQWDGTTLTSGSSIAQGTTDGLWSGCPSVIDPNPYKAFTFFDDFVNGVDLATDYIVTTGAGGTISYDDTRGGIVLIPTAVTDNDHMGLATRSQCFNVLDTKALWFEARFRVVESNTNESSWWFGLSNTLTTGGYLADTGGPLASYDGILIHKIEGTMQIDAQSSNAGDQDEETNLGTFVTNTWTRVGFHITAAATNAIVHYYTDVNDSGTMTAYGTTTSIARTGMQEMHVIFGIKSGPTSAVEPLEVDYVKCVQIR